MAYKINKKAAAAAEPVETKAAGNRVTRINPVTNGKNGLVAFVSFVYGDVFYNDMQVVENKDGELRLQPPYVLRKDKDGNFVKDENGYNIRDEKYGPASADVREAWNELIIPAVIEKLEEAE